MVTQELEHLRSVQDMAQLDKVMMVVIIIILVHHLVQVAEVGQALLAKQHQTEEEAMVE